MLPQTLHLRNHRAKIVSQAAKKSSDWLYAADGLTQSEDWCVVVMSAWTDTGSSAVQVQFRFPDIVVWCCSGAVQVQFRYKVDILEICKS